MVRHQRSQDGTRRAVGVAPPSDYAPAPTLSPSQRFPSKMSHSVGFRVVEVSAENRLAVVAFLERYAETSLFLVSNLAEHGTELGAGMNSGNFKCLMSGTEIYGVFCLTRRGNILAETAGRADLAVPIAKACLSEGRAVEGIVGEWRAAEAICRELVASAGFVERSRSKESLFRLELSSSSSSPAPPLAHDPSQVRRLGPADFEQWEPLNTAYMIEEGLPAQGTLEERRSVFESGARADCWWGYWVEGELRGVVALNAKHGSIGQVGGVYTAPRWRRQGYCRAIMGSVLRDSVNVHHLAKLVLFTGDKNRAARPLYEALGFTRIGDFGLLFGALRPPPGPERHA